MECIHDGCEGCKWVSKEEWEEPCDRCKQSCVWYDKEYQYREDLWERSQPSVPPITRQLDKRHKKLSIRHFLETVKHWISR